ncbi:MAG: hypothetical protein KGV59_01475 [Tenacibaculum sp.]|nr:hypothetical protein [Tenacibaculum sp.]
MKVQEWLNNGQDYQKGIALYQTLKGAKPNLIRLFLKKETKANADKLTYELSKLKDNQEIINTDSQKITNLNKSKTDDLKVNNQEKKATTPLFFYKLNQLHKDLHEVARLQRDNFQKAVSLKLQLNDLHKDDEIRALKICIEIERLFDEIDNIQKILEHYVNHKVVLLPKTSDFTDLSPAQLLQRRNNKRANKSKITKKLERLNIESLKENLTIAKRTKIDVQIEKNNAKLLILDQDIIELDKLINSDYDKLTSY